MPLLLVNGVNLYKALYYLTSDITSLTLSSSTLPFFLLSATLAFFLFSSNWPGFLPPWPLSSKQHILLVFIPGSFSGGLPGGGLPGGGLPGGGLPGGGLPGGPFSACPYCLAIMCDIPYILFLFSLSICSLFLSVYTWGTLSSWWKGFLLFMFTTKRL